MYSCYYTTALLRIGCQYLIKDLETLHTNISGGLSVCLGGLEKTEVDIVSLISVIASRYEKFVK